MAHRAGRGMRGAGGQQPGARLGAVILNWNDADRTLAAVRSLSAWASPPFVCIVDNASADGSRLRSAGVQVLYNSRNLGFAGGNNRGISRALEEGCTEILLLNSDAEISEEGVRSLARALRDHPSIGIIGPAVREGGRVFAGGRDIAWHVDTRVPGKAPGGGPVTADYVPGMVFLARSAVFASVGLLDERYFFSGEVADFCRRARDHGYACAVCPGVVAVHRPDQGMPLRSTLYPYYALRNRFLFLREHHPALRPVLEPFWVLWGFAMSVRAFLAGSPEQSRAYRIALVHGVKGMYGDRNAEFHA